MSKDALMRSTETIGFPDSNRRAVGGYSFAWSTADALATRRCDDQLSAHDGRRTLRAARRASDDTRAGGDRAARVRTHGEATGSTNPRSARE